VKVNVVVPGVAFGHGHVTDGVTTGFVQFVGPARSCIVDRAARELERKVDVQHIPGLVRRDHRHRE
jgi:hypothetical protein